MKKAIFTSLREAPSQHVLLVMVHPWYPLLPPLGLAYVSKYVRSKGYEVLLFDFNAKLYNNCDSERKKFWDISTISRIPYPQLVEIFREKFCEEIEDLISLLAQRSEPIIGFSTNYLNVKVASYIAKGVKEKNQNKIIVFGGPGCFWDYDRNNVLPGSVDFFVIGEGERPFFELVDNFYKGKSLKGIAGIISGNENRQVKTNPIMNLDEIPFPDFKEFDLNDYGCGEDRALPLLTSRGCISKCSFCVDYMMCNPFRMRSPEHVVAEIEYHIKEYNIQNFSFNDLLCNGDLRKLERICDLIIDKKLNIKWGSYAIARGDMSLELLQKMRKAGCTTICYGIESGSNKVLKAMHKIYTAEDAERTLRLTHQAGIKATFNIIIGHPQEGSKEFKETLSFVKRNKDYIDSVINVSTLFINPTASLGREPQKYGLYFPKSPYAFKFISLKKLIPGYYKIFGQMTPVKRLQGIDISEFTDRYGNTKNVRIKRLIKTLNLLNKLGLFKEDPIINVYVTKNKKLSRIINKIQKRWVIENGDLCLKCDYKGLGKLEYKGRLITWKAGFNSALLINNKWYDSSCYEWRIKKMIKKKINIVIKMEEIGISQMWILRFINNDSLIWKWKLWGDRKIEVKTVKLGLLLPDFYRYWKNEAIVGELPDLGDKWKSIEFKGAYKIILLPSDSNYPALRLTLIKKGKEATALRLETAIKEYDFRFVNFNFQDLNTNGKRQLQMGGRIEVKVCPHDIYSIMDVRKGEEKGFDKFYKGDLDDAVVFLPYFLTNKHIEVQINNGIKIIYDDKKITAEFGGNVSFLCKGILYDTTRDVELIANNIYKNVVEVGFSWRDLPLELLWEVHLKKNSLIWKWKLISLDSLAICDLKIGLLLVKDYICWASENSCGYFPLPQEGKWLTIPVRESQNKRIRLKLLPSREEYPIIDIQKSRLGKFQLEVPASDKISGIFVHNVISNYNTPSSGSILKGMLEITFGEKRKIEN